jgi:hypothetical protein
VGVVGVEGGRVEGERKADANGSIRGEYSGGREGKREKWAGREFIRAAMIDTRGGGSI